MQKKQKIKNYKINISNIKRIKSLPKYDLILDPHSAIGIGALQKLKLSKNVISLATAHPSKFPEAISKAINKTADLPKQFEDILLKKEKFKVLDNNIDKIKKYVKQKVYEN